MYNKRLDFRKIYGGKRVFLTGHTGFKGAWLVKILSMLGAEVKGYALGPKTKDDLFKLIDGEKLCHSIIADIRDKEKLVSEIVNFQPDFIFHLAAQSLVKLSYEIPSETFEVNAIGTAHLLDAVRLLPNPCSVVLITTDKVYHNNEWLYPYREADRLGGYDPYSASKACMELIIDSYRNSFFNIKEYKAHKKGIAVGRAGNVIGGGDWAKNRLLPDIARALGKGQKIIIRNPKSVRPWQHVLEPLAGYLLLGSRLKGEPQKFSQAYNFGPHVSDTLMVKEMATIAIDIWGNGGFEVIENKNQPHEAGLLKLDISKANAELGWQPKMNATKAVELTLGWYKEFFNDGNMKKITEEQIKSFL